MGKLRQAGFGHGEVSPYVWARSDTPVVQQGVKTCLNGVVAPQGPIYNRPGLKYLHSSPNAARIRLVPFRFSNSNNVIMEFGDLYVRFIQNGAYLLNLGNPVEVVTPFTADNLRSLKFDQSGDVVTITGPYRPYELRRYSNTDWQLVKVSDRAPKRWAHAPVTATTYPAGSIIRVPGTILTQAAFWYTAASNTNPPGGAGWVKVTDGLPPADLYFMKTNAPAGATGTALYDVNQTAPDAAHPTKRFSYVVTCLFPDGRESLPSEPLYAKPSAADGNVHMKIVRYADAPVIVAWDSVTGASGYRVYGGWAGVYGYLGEASVAKSDGSPTVSFEDAGIAPDFAQTPPLAGCPIDIEAFAFGRMYRAGEQIENTGTQDVYECTVSGIYWPSTALGVGQDEISGTFGSWAAGTVYAPGDKISHNGVLLQCYTGGTSATAGTPSGPWGSGVFADLYNGFLDGTVVWRYIGTGGPAHWKYLGKRVDVGYPYPTCSTYYNQRHVFAVRNRILATKVGDFGSFVASTPLLADSAIDFMLDSGQLEEVKSIVAARTLLVLSDVGEWTITGAGGAPLSATSVSCIKQGYRGSGLLDPLFFDNVAWMAQERGNIVREVEFDLFSESYKSSDVSTLARHLFEGYTIVDWTYTTEGHGVVWAVRSDGVLLGCTYSKEYKVMAWHRHVTDGTFESIATIMENGRDTTYVVVKRGSAWNVERFAPRPMTMTTPQEWLFLDAYMTTSGVAVTAVSNLTHLVGKSVMIVADGQVLGPYTVGVEGGVSFADALPEGASFVVAGLPYTMDIVLLPLMAQEAEVRTNRKNVNSIDAELYQTRALSAGPDATKLSEFPDRAPADEYGYPGLFTGVAKVRIKSTYENEGCVLIRHDSPVPFTLLAVTRGVDIGGD